MVSRELPVFSCPSDSTGSMSTAYRYHTNYDFVVPWDHDICNYWVRRPLSKKTMFEDGSRCRMADVSDGTSNTFAMAETRKACCSNGNNANWGHRGYIENGISFDVYPPNTTARPPNVDTPPRLGNWSNSGSMHVGGLHVLMADGAVRWVADNTSNAVLENLERLADGNVVGEW